MKYKFRTNEKATVTVTLEEEEKKRPKGIISPITPPEYLKRRFKNAVIILYDLAQINIGTQESPVWSDHPIIKSPSYSVSFTPFHVDYRVEDFTDTDYQNFTDSLFELGPVENWKNIFRRMELVPEPTLLYLEEYPVTISVESPVSNDLIAVMKNSEGVRVEDITTPAGKADRLESLNNFGLCWDSKGLEYRNLDILHWNSSQGPTVGSINMEWHPFDDDNPESYKVTETYDSSAADVMADLTYSGRIELYLIPMPCLYFAVGALAADYNNSDGFNVMFAYQVLPRQNFPDYADPLGLLSNDARTSNFLDYQKTRVGMVASHWFESAPGVISETPITPSTFMAGVDSYRGQVTNSTDTVFYLDAIGTYETYSRQTSDRFNRDSWLLGAVMKLKGRFYYLWVDETQVDTLADNTNGYAVESDSYPD